MNVIKLVGRVCSSYLFDIIEESFIFGVALTHKYTCTAEWKRGLEMELLTDDRFLCLTVFTLHSPFFVETMETSLVKVGRVGGVRSANLM